MRFTDYQDQSRQTAVYPGAGNPDSVDGLAYVTLGLAGEAGELANKVKKILRDQGGVITDQNRRELADELGDVLWYVSQFATQLDVWLVNVADDNLSKLKSRKERGVLSGSGDNR